MQAVNLQAAGAGLKPVNAQSGPDQTAQHGIEWA